MKKSVLVSVLGVAALLGAAAPALAASYTFSTTVNGDQARPHPTTSKAVGEAVLVVDKYDSS